MACQGFAEARIAFFINPAVYAGVGVKPNLQHYYAARGIVLNSDMRRESADFRHCPCSGNYRFSGAVFGGGLLAFGGIEQRQQGITHATCRQGQRSRLSCLSFTVSTGQRLAITKSTAINIARQITSTNTIASSAARSVSSALIAGSTIAR